MTSLFNSPLLLSVLAIVALQAFYLLFYSLRKTNVNKCPSCGNLHCDRVKRPFLVKLFLSYFSDMKYYKCPSCNANFFIVQKKDNSVDENSKFLKV